MKSFKSHINENPETQNKYQRFVSKMREACDLVNGFNPHEIIFGNLDGDGPLGGITLSNGSDHVWINDLRSIRRGGGKLCMAIIIHAADQDGIRLMLNATPTDGTTGGLKMSVAALEAWYEKLGFQKDEGMDVMVREPRVLQRDYKHEDF